MVTITIDNLSKYFGDVRALSSVSITINPGEIFFLLGPSGCGKTTLLRNIAGFYTPDEGRILFNDEDVTNLPPHQRNTGMMFQSYALWPHMTVEKNVAFGLEERKVPRQEIRQRVAAVLDSVKMAGYAERKINQLSGGQQQRVALARALVIRPRALLLDEPLSNLDAKLRLEMRSEIRRVCREFGLTAVYVTHDQKEALSISDRMAILDSGRIAQTGTPHEIYRRPANSLVAHFIGETNFIDGTVVGHDQRRYRVDTQLGQFSGVTSNGFQPDPGTSVQLSIRPEALELADTSTAENVIDGVLKAQTYLGEVSQYMIETNGGNLLKMFELNPQFALQQQDERVRLAASSEDVVILPK